DFTFYGMSYTKMAVCSNGGITFRPAEITNAEFKSYSVRALLPLSIFQNSLPRIALYWWDLNASADATEGENGIYVRREPDRIVVSWNNVSQFPNRPTTPRCRFQATLFADGRILTVYQTVQFPPNTFTNIPVVAGISPGNSNVVPSIIDLSNPPT